MSTNFAQSPTQPNERGLGTGPARRRIWRGLILPLVLLAVLYGGFRVGLMLGMVQAVYQQLEIHAPRVVQIGEVILGLPEIERQITQALARGCPDAATLGLALQSRGSDPAPANTRLGAPGRMRSYPQHWDADPFASSR